MYLPDHRALSLEARRELRRRHAFIVSAENQLDLLAWQANRQVPGARRRFLTRVKMLMHPVYEWPDWWAEFHGEELWWLRWGRQAGAIRRRFFEAPSVRRVAGGAPSIVANAYYVDPLNGNDSNNGRLASEGGTGAWQTWSKLATELEAGTFSVGNHIYLRGGTYEPSARIEPTGGGTTAGASKITIEGYPGETANIDYTTTDDTSQIEAGTGYSPITMVSSNYRWKNLTTTCYYAVWGTDNTGNGEGCEFLGITRVKAGTASSGGNGGVIKLMDGSIGFLIEGCTLAESEIVGTPSANDAVLYNINTTSGMVRNNWVAFRGSAGHPYHHKRAVMNSGTRGDITIENNTFYNPAGPILKFDGTQKHLIQNNILYGPAGNNAMAWGDNGVGSGSAWYDCGFEHNTIAIDGSHSAQGLVMYFNRGGGASPAGTDNSVRNNVVEGSYHINPNDATPYNHNTDSDYNLVDNRGTQDFRLFSGNIYTNITDWRNVTSNFAGGAHDQNSFHEQIQWATTRDVNDPTTFALGGTSSGIGAADDATDMGADVSAVGPAAAGY